MKTSTTSDCSLSPPWQGTAITAKPVGAAVLALVLLCARAASAQPSIDTNKYKWYQPPEPAYPTNVYYGWNELSSYFEGPIIADDWVCTNAAPVTGVRWWGSFLNWSGVNPPALPGSFQFNFWTDVPAGGTETFSHPGTCVHLVTCTNYSWRFVGWDFDPRSQTYEACFEFEQRFTPEECFYQDPYPPINIYWLSIAADYRMGMPAHPWGWKTRPRATNSPAPDDAVRIFNPVAPIVWSSYVSGEPIYFPDPTNSWDMAFELLNQEFAYDSKAWRQVPDLTTNGIDINVTGNGTPPPFLLADDFLCTSHGWITNIAIYGSWLNDKIPGNNPTNISFKLSIHADIPASISPTGYSMPGTTLWWTNFNFGQFDCVQTSLQQGYEGWWNPNESSYIVQGDHNCFRYSFSIPSDGAFEQMGDPAYPIVYWLDVQAFPKFATNKFGWKTCPTNWNDDAVWVSAQEPYNGNWNRMTYPYPHPRFGQTLDMAFEIHGTGQGQLEEGTKWSQPPEPHYPTNAFYGWNEQSVDGYPPIVADDWVCTNAKPVTDIHWWGSFIGWGNYGPPQMPNGFRISFWKDVPASGTEVSHPGEWRGEIICTNFSWEFAGWDFDPRNSNSPPETCYKFEQFLDPTEWFHQDPGSNIYWISIAAIYSYGQMPEYPFGWKTRPHLQTSPAPDDAVRFTPYTQFYEHLWWPYETNSWDAAFALTTRDILTSTNDFGDAPLPYPTKLPNGASHLLTPGIRLGLLIDAEADGIPDPLALGDDNNNLGDEDGVSLGGRLVPGEVAQVNVTPSVNGFLSAWLDFDGDGTWATPGDQIFSDQPVVGGAVNALNFNVPQNALASGSYTFARFRFSTVSNAANTFTGWAPDGEVEDFRWYIEQLDYGDAPDGPYPTLRANNGARHILVQGIFLGASVDAELDGQPAPLALGDDNNPLFGVDDEDGVGVLSPLVAGQLATIQVTASGGAFLNAWVDFGGDGSWATPGDQIAGNLILAAGPNVLTFMVPATANSNLCARFRYSTMTNLTFTGIAPNGEVEDYLWHLSPLDYGDAPDPAYPTLQARNGARHAIGNLFLGALIDAEANGQPGPNATGDDLAGVADEDGVVFNTALVAGVSASVTVTCTGAGLLQGWIDFNRNGSWADPGDQVFVNQPVVAGANVLTFAVPGGLVPGKTFARFRLSSQLGLSYTGYAPDGEVEDYAAKLYSLKWVQPPDLSTNGVDVDDRFSLADDFRCTQTGPITDIHIWGSFEGDTQPPGVDPAGMRITLTIHADVPVGPGNPYGYSYPGQALWTNVFMPGQYQAARVQYGVPEWWHTPNNAQPTWIPNADLSVYQYDFYITSNAFHQVEGTVYWLEVSYQLIQQPYYFGWKSSTTNWNDAACWLDPTGGIPTWRPLHYGDGHPFAPNQIDLSFALSGMPEAIDLDFGDAPDLPYPTLLANNGARHYAVPGFKLGLREDTEADGFPHPQALGDDLDNPPTDEEGVLFTTWPLLISTQACVSVTLTSAGGQPGLLDGWIDFNGNGIWEPAEQVFNSQVLLPGLNPGLCFPVPSTAKLGTNYARFRLSSTGGLGPTGLAQDGEVEDYQLPIYQANPGTITITNISVTGPSTNRLVTVKWNAQPGVQYQLKAAGALTNSSIIWTNVGGVVIGPAYSQTDTNATLFQRFYRIAAPWAWP